MKKPSLLVVATSLLAGAILTAAFLAQMSWRTYANYNCQVPTSTARTEGCAIMEYGYPKRWVTSDVNVGEQNVIFATSSFNKANLVFDWIILSGLSFIVLYIISAVPSTTTGKPSKSKHK